MNRSTPGERLKRAEYRTTSEFRGALRFEPVGCGEQLHEFKQKAHCRKR